MFVKRKFGKNKNKCLVLKFMVLYIDKLYVLVVFVFFVEVGMV